MIDPKACISQAARIANTVTIGPYTVIGPDVEIGEGTWIGPSVVINGPTIIGKDNKIFQFSSLGEAPQDLKYQGEKTYLQIGDNNTIRECTTINRGTQQGGGITRIGHHNLFMAYVHIAHDCVIGNNNVFANHATLAGHVIVEDHVTLAGFTGVAQGCRVGAYSFTGGHSGVRKDIPPYIKVSGFYAKPYGLNTVGLARVGFDNEMIKELRQAYKILYRESLTVSQAIEKLQTTCLQTPLLEALIQFIKLSSLGIIR